MNSKYISIGLIVGILVIGIGGVIVFALSQNGSSDSEMSAMHHHDHAMGNHHGEENAVETNEVKIENFAFTPEAIKVKTGTKVTWTNQDGVGHTVTSEDGGDKIMDSKLLDKGDSYSVTFTKAGTFPYYCKPHTYMKGTVVVTD